MMVLLTVLAVGLLSLSSIELRKSSSASPMEQARANARLGMILALGQLQQHCGPDQRITADAQVAAGRSKTPTQSHWVSVWRSTKADGSPWIVRNAAKGGLEDQRQDSPLEAIDERIACLVSGNESGITHTGEHAEDPASMVSLVSKGSLGDQADAADQVRAPRVTIGPEGKPKGAYAWWVGDLGAQANVATRDASENAPDGQYHTRMLAQDVSWQAFGKAELPATQRGKLASEGELKLAAPELKNRGFHDLTVWSAGLPVNVREGGWRRDLTAYLASTGSVPEFNQGNVRLPGLADSDNLVGSSAMPQELATRTSAHSDRLSDVSPNFGLLRTWAKRASDAPLGSFKTKSELAEMVDLPTGGRNSQSVDFRNRITTHLMPVLADSSIYYNLSYYDPAKPVTGNPYAMRVHFYPRVALWNPYNFALEVPASAIFLQINGSKSVEVTMQNGLQQTYRMYWGLTGGATGGAVRGSLFFKMEAATIAPGQTLVWSPTRNAEYDETNFANNLLTTGVAPSPGRAFYQDKRADGYPLFQVQQGFPPKPGLANNLLPKIPLEWREIVPPRPSGNLQAAAYTQADDYIASWKPMSGPSLSASSFAAMPMGRFISCAYQFGDEDELPVEWTSLDPVPFPKSSLTTATVTDLPDRRTRDGFRLRWLDEPESNVIGSGSLARTPHLQDAAVGNWNMRASWSYRNPFDNVTDVAPHFFGIYTRDLFDGAVDWSSLTPRSAGGTSLGDPYDQPVNGPGARILFDVPRRETAIASLGAFQHANFSEFIWHPTYAFGNSLADPRVPPNHTEPDRSESIIADKGGWNQDTLGYATDGRSNTNGATNRTNEDNWAWHARNFLQQTALDQTLVYDLSYELNHTLWDGYFLSSGTPADKQAFLKDPLRSPLPNGRVKTNPLAGQVTAADLTDYHRAASHLLIDGAFNVNSTSIAAWEALLLSGLGQQSDAQTVAFPRLFNAPAGDWNGKGPRNPAAWAGQRVFARAEIRKLAEQIVIEVKGRGPFLSLADFVNRRLSGDETSKKGALQAAIDGAGLNAAFTDEWPLDNSKSLPDYKNSDHIVDSTRFEQTRKPDTTAWGALGFLTQADLLQFIGPALTARSDTFRIRAYGECLDAAGKVMAKAWCETVVQRSPGYVDGTDTSLALPATLSATNRRFGRRFEIIAFRWLRPEEI